MRRQSSPLTEKQLAAVKILFGRRDMPLTEKVTNPKAINRTTAWGLEEAGVALTYFVHGDTPMKERVKLLPRSRQLVALGKELA